MDLMYGEEMIGKVWSSALQTISLAGTFLRWKYFPERTLFLEFVI
jgi:hypothetical protein